MQVEWCYPKPVHSKIVHQWRTVPILFLFCSDEGKYLVVGRIAVELAVPIHLLRLLDPLLALLPHLAFIFVSAVNQAINLLDKVAETVLLLTQ